MPYGRHVIGSMGADIQVAAGVPLEWMRSGVTFDWTGVAAISGSPFTLPEGISVPVGQKFIRFGQVVTKITNPSSFSLTVSGTPTGGTFALTTVRPDNGATFTQAIPYNASVAQVQAALDAAYGAGNTLVAGGGPLPGNVLTITGQGTLLFCTIPAPTANSTNLSGGTTPSAAVAVTNAGANTGWFGPYDPNATDGRQTLSRGGVAIVNRTILQSGILGTFTVRNPDNIGVLTGGPLFKGRVLATTGSASLLNGPTFAAIETAMPHVRWITN